MSGTKFSNDEILRLSSFGVKVAKERFGISLDYTKNSLYDLDKLLENAYNRFNELALEGNLSEESINRTSKIWGSYLGEVIQNNFGGYWAKENEKLLLVVSTESLDPIGFVNTRITSVSQKKATDYYDDSVKRITSNTSIDSDDPLSTNDSILSESKSLEYESPTNKKLLLAFELYNKGDKQQAVKLFSELVKQDINNTSAWYGLALSLVLHQS